MKKLFSFVICIVLAFVVAFGGGNVVCAADERVDKALYNFNTENIVSLVGANANDAFDEIEKEFNKIDKTFSLNETSQIKKLNEQGYITNALFVSA